MTLLDYVQDIKIKEKVFLLAADASWNDGNGLLPQQYAVKDLNDLPLLYAMEYSECCNRCWCPAETRALRFDVVPAAAVHDPTGEAQFNIRGLLNEADSCYTKEGAAPDCPIAFTIERTAGCELACCRCRCCGACMQCCYEDVIVRKGPAPPDGLEDTRPIVSGVRQNRWGGGLTPIYEINGSDRAGKYDQKGHGGCQTCPGFCMCAWTDNTFGLYDRAKSNEQVGEITRKALENCGDFFREICTPADNYEIHLPAVSKEDKAGMLAGVFLTDMSVQTPRTFALGTHHCSLTCVP